MIGDILKRIARQVAREGISSIIKQVMKRNPALPPTSNPSSRLPPIELNKEHPWRQCGQGRHWVATHSLTVPANGNVVPRTGHCASNPGSKKGIPVPFYMKPDEAAYIRDTYFSAINHTLQKGKFPRFELADSYDDLIEGWTRYWNEVFNPLTVLDPMVIKALIISESGSKLSPGTPNSGTAGLAHGLIQLTDQAIQALGDPDGELKNHLFKITQADISDPNLSVCGGIRWLFQKQRLASGKLGREASWEEAIAD